MHFTEEETEIPKVWGRVFIARWSLVTAPMFVYLRCESTREACVSVACDCIIVACSIGAQLNCSTVLDVFVCEWTCGPIATWGQFCVQFVSWCQSIHLFERRGPRATAQYWWGDLSQPIRRGLELFPAQTQHPEAVFYSLDQSVIGLGWDHCSWVK